MDKKFCFYVMFKKSFIFMIRLFNIFICCLLKCYNLYIDVVMLMKFLSEGWVGVFYYGYFYVFIRFVWVVN